MKISRVAAVGLTLPVFFILASSALAFNLPGQATDRVSAAGATPSANGKLQSCQARERGIKQRSEQLVDLVTTMETKFGMITTRVEDYYKNKVLPSGKTVPNYDSLVASIAAKKVVVQTDLTKAKNDVASFSCTSGDPKAQMTQFRLDMQAVKGALKDYRTAIKNLIVAVHSVTGQDNKTATESGKN